MKTQLLLSHSVFIVGRSPLIAAMATTLTVRIHSQTILIDPVGDASGHHDAIAISGGFTRSNLYLTGTFSNGTLNRTNLGLIFGLDTDQNPNTGVQPPAFFPLGADFSMFFDSLADSNNVIVFDVAAQQQVGAFAVTFGQDSLSIVLPLSVLGNDDGVMSFGFIAGVPTSANSFTPFDVVPDSADGGPLEGLTSALPELAIRQAAGSVVLRWPVGATNYFLESASSLSFPASWDVVTNAVGIVDGEFTITDATTGAMKLYRLKQ